MIGYGVLIYWGRELETKLASNWRVRKAFAIL